MPRPRQVSENISNHGLTHVLRSNHVHSRRMALTAAVLTATGCAGQPPTETNREKPLPSIVVRSIASGGGPASRTKSIALRDNGVLTYGDWHRGTQVVYRRAFLDAEETRELVAAFREPAVREGLVAMRGEGLGRDATSLMVEVEGQSGEWSCDCDNPSGAVNAPTLRLWLLAAPLLDLSMPRASCFAVPDTSDEDDEAEAPAKTEAPRKSPTSKYEFDTDVVVFDCYSGKSKDRPARAREE